MSPGAIFGDDPKVIFVKMLRRYEYYSGDSRLGKICVSHTKFNESLTLAAAKFDNNIMNVNTCARPDHFDICGNLSSGESKIAL